jgi:hypothetical protein
MIQQPNLYSHLKRKKENLKKLNNNIILQIVMMKIGKLNSLKQ